VCRRSHTLADFTAVNLTIKSSVVRENSNCNHVQDSPTFQPSGDPSSQFLLMEQERESDHRRFINLI
jgi:hypothetical protein